MRLGPHQLARDGRNRLARTRPYRPERLWHSSHGIGLAATGLEEAIDAGIELCQVQRHVYPIGHR